MPRPKRAKVARAGQGPGPVKTAPRASNSDDGHYDNDVGLGKPRVVEDNSLKTSGRTRNAGQTRVLQSSMHHHDDSMTRIEQDHSISTVEKAPSDDNLSPPSLEMSRRGCTPPRHTRGDLTGLDLDDDMFGGDLNLDDTSFDDTENHGSAAVSANTSTLTISNFRKRPRSRANSVVGRGDTVIRPSSRGQNTTGISSTLNLGLFKRREREPSILGTAQKKKSLRLEVDEGDTRDMLDDEMDQSDEEGEKDDSLVPDAESTPLRRKSARTSGRATEATAQSPALEGVVPGPENLAGNPDITSKKRKFSDAHPNAEDFEDDLPSQAPSPGPDSPLASVLSLSPSIPASPRSPSPMLPRTRAYRSRTPDELDLEILAPPASSDSGGSSPALPSIAAAGRRRRQHTPPPLIADESDISSPPSLTHSPHRPPPRATRARPAPKKNVAGEKMITTAELTNLLPRRRQRRGEWASDGEAEEEDGSPIDNTRLGEEDDELSYLSARPRRVRPASRVPTVAKLNLNKKGSEKAEQQHNKTKKRGGRVSRTYGRREEDEENVLVETSADEARSSRSGSRELDEGDAVAPAGAQTFDGNEDSVEPEQRIGPELEQARRKFQEVDKWELSFEEVLVGSSSPAGAGAR